MKPLLYCLMVGSLVALVGCNASPTGGGSTTVGGKGGTFKLVGPTTSTEVKQGAEVPVKITVDRQSDFKEDVALSATVEPSGKGVTVKAPETVKMGDAKETEVKVAASDTAAPGDYEIHVTGKPAKGAPTTLNFKVKVPEKK